MATLNDPDLVPATTKEAFETSNTSPRASSSSPSPSSSADQIQSQVSNILKCLSKAVTQLRSSGLQIKLHHFPTVLSRVRTNSPQVAMTIHCLETAVVNVQAACRHGAPIDQDSLVGDAKLVDLIDDLVFAETLERNQDTVKGEELREALEKLCEKANRMLEVVRDRKKEESKAEENPSQPQQTPPPANTNTRAKKMYDAMPEDQKATYRQKFLRQMNSVRKEEEGSEEDDDNSGPRLVVVSKERR